MLSIFRNISTKFDKIKKDPQRVSKIKPYIEKYNWKDIDFPSTSKDWKKIECNNEVALNILYVPYNTKKINIAYKSKNNLTQERQIILLMISDGQKWHYLLVKNLSGLLRGITSNHKEDFYCLNCFHSYRTENKLEAHKKICENHDYCHVVFHNGSTYDYHFIIKELVKEFNSNFECLGENNEKYITFSVPIKKKIENKDLEITYKIKFIDRYIFMASSLSKLVDNLFEDIHNNKCVNCNYCLDYIKIKNEKLILE